MRADGERGFHDAVVHSTKKRDLCLVAGKSKCDSYNELIILYIIYYIFYSIQRFNEIKNCQYRLESVFDVTYIGIGTY